MALKLDKYPDRPLIGRIARIQGASIEVDWMVGTYSGQWREWKGRQDGKTIIFSDTVRRENII